MAFSAMKGFDKLLGLLREDIVAEIFSDGITPDNVNCLFIRGAYQHTLLSLATSLNWNKPDDLERIRDLLTMGAEISPLLLAHVNTQKQLRVILYFGVDPIQLGYAVRRLYYMKQLTTYTRRVKDLIMYGGVPKDLNFIRSANTKTKTRIFIEKVEQRVNNCRSALLTLILCIQQKYKPLKWLIRRFAMRIWSFHPFCSDLETPSAGPRSEVWDWDEKSGSRAPSKKQKC